MANAICRPLWFRHPGRMAAYKVNRTEENHATDSHEIRGRLVNRSTGFEYDAECELKFETEVRGSGGSFRPTLHKRCTFCSVRALNGEPVSEGEYEFSEEGKPDGQMHHLEFRSGIWHLPRLRCGQTFARSNFAP